MTGSAGPFVGQPAAPLDAGRSLEIFISYRRDDSAPNAGRLADALVNRFGRDSVFMDVDTIEPGADYTEVIDRAVGHCDVLIALIGPHWLDSANARGRRLDDPKDLVRLEIQSALSRNIRVIPALVGGARMPDAEELPAELASLSKRNAIELSHARFQSDLQLLLKPLEKIAEQKGISRSAEVSFAAPAPPPRPMPVKQSKPLPTLAPSRLGRMPLIAAAVALVLLIALVGWVAFARSGAHSLLNQSNAPATWPSSYEGTWRGTGHEFNPPGDFAITLTFKPGNVGQVVGHMDRPTLGCSADLILDKVTSQSIALTEQGGGGVCTISGQGVGASKLVVSRKGTGLDWKEFPGEPASTNASATATLASGTSGPIPGTTGLLAIPDGFVGTWRGTGHESLPTGDFAIILTLKPGNIGETVGHMDRPSVGCGADLTLDKATSQAVTLTEQGGGGVCVISGQGVGGQKLVLTLAGGAIDWKEYQGEPSTTSPSANASLGQGTSGPVPGTSNLVAVPDGFVQTWKGTGHEFSPSGDFGITLTVRGGMIGETVAHLDRPSLGCGADLTLDKATASALFLTEQGGGGVCVINNQGVGGSKIVVALNGTSLDWKEYPGEPSSTSAIATATLASS